MDSEPGAASGSGLLRGTAAELSVSFVVGTDGEDRDVVESSESEDLVGLACFLAST